MREVAAVLAVSVSFNISGPWFMSQHHQTFRNVPQLKSKVGLKKEEEA